MPQFWSVGKVLFWWQIMIDGRVVNLHMTRDNYFAAVLWAKTSLSFKNDRRFWKLIGTWQKNMGNLSTTNISIQTAFLHLGVLFYDGTSFLTYSFLTNSIQFNSINFYCLDNIDLSAPHHRGWIFQSSSQIPPYDGMVGSGITQKIFHPYWHSIRRFIPHLMVNSIGYRPIG